uniref:Glycosyl transferase 48 domain-containing protein n=1 Tax=Fagus sylvatica TaxID=28930 RepID=A0A2N9IA53_FAGSY
MNQDNYMEEALKMRNLLQEFLKKHDGVRYPTILGLREHIFTGSVSSLAWFMSNQETSFVTIGQRLLANPLKVRFHYGHPDVFDRLFHLTRGGVSKASKITVLTVYVFLYGRLYLVLSGLEEGLSLWSILAGDLTNIVCDEDCLRWAAEVQCKFSTRVPAYKRNDIPNFCLHSGHFDCPPSHDIARHHCLHSWAFMPTVTNMKYMVTLIALPHMNCKTSLFAFSPLCQPVGVLILIAQACKPLVHRAGFWGSVRTLARGYEIIMGLLLFTPVAFLAWFPFVSEFQTRMLFNQAFSRGLQISRILGGQRKDRSSRNKE